jgi:hypothetical protein
MSNNNFYLVIAIAAVFSAVLMFLEYTEKQKARKELLTMANSQSACNCADCNNPPAASSSTGNTSIPAGGTVIVSA